MEIAFFLVFALAIYLLPFGVAWERRHNNRLAIFWLNAFAGWTFIGWVGALVWACTNNVRTPMKTVQVEKSQAAPAFEPR
ncbi:MAG: superinfection immunity protein [Pseudolabrys sp.]